MNRASSVLSLVFLAPMLACSSSGSDTGSSSSSGGSSTSSSSSSSGGSDGGGSSFTCTLGARGADSLKTTYTCPDQASSSKCSGGDSTSCTPKDKKPGTVALGGTCVKAFTAGSPGDEYELADDCAPSTKYGGQGAGKGSYCAFGYCTHKCSQASQCTDLAATATCDSLGNCTK